MDDNSKRNIVFAALAVVVLAGGTVLSCLGRRSIAPGLSEVVLVPTPLPSAPASASASPDPEHVDESKRLFLVVRSKTPVRLHDMAGAVFVASERSFAKAESDGFTSFEPPIRESSEPLKSGWGGLRRTYGTWPDDAVSVVTTASGCRGSTYGNAAWNGQRWVVRDERYVSALGTFRGGVVGIESSKGVWVGKKHGPLPVFDIPEKPLFASCVHRGESTPQHPYEILTVGDFSFASIYCSGKTQHWFLTPGTTVARAISLPAPVSSPAANGAISPENVNISSIAVRGSTDVYVGGAVTEPQSPINTGRPYLARWDGKHWTAESLPDTGGKPAYVYSLSVMPDGTLWMITGATSWRRRGGDPSDSLWRRGSGESTWQKVDLRGQISWVGLSTSAKIYPTEVLVGDTGDLWLAASVEPEQVADAGTAQFTPPEGLVFRTKALRTVMTVP